MIANEQQLSQLQEKADTILLDERLSHASIYASIEHKLNGSDMILHDRYAIDLTLGSPRSLTSFVYHLYTDHIAHDAHDLANYLDEHHGDTYIIRVETVTPHKKVFIKANGRLVIALNGIRFPIKRNPILEASVKMSHLRVSEPWILLMNLYRTLGICSKAGEWKDLLPVEQDLFKTFAKDVGNTKVGTSSSDIIMKVLDIIVDNKNIVLVGEIALGMPSNRVEILTMLSDDDVKDLMAKSIGTQVKYKKSKIITPTDNKLVRTEYFANDVAFLYKYNILDYEVINFGTLEDESGRVIRVANVFCIFWLMLTNLWIIYWLYLGDIIKESYYNHRRKEILATFLATHDRLYADDGNLSAEYGSPISSSYIFIENFIGQYFEDSRLTKIGADNDKKDKIIPPYLPRVYKHIHGEYKNIQSSS